MEEFSQIGWIENKKNEVWRQKEVRGESKKQIMILKRNNKTKEDLLKPRLKERKDKGKKENKTKHNNYVNKEDKKRKKKWKKKRTDPNKKGNRMIFIKNDKMKS